MKQYYHDVSGGSITTEISYCEKAAPPYERHYRLMHGLTENESAQGVSEFMNCKTLAPYTSLWSADEKKQIIQKMPGSNHHWSPIGFDSSGRRLYKEAIDYKSNNMDNHTPRSTNEKLYNYSVDSLVLAIKAAVRITDVNLIAIDNRIKASRRSKDTDRVILQSEALSIFKGNFIRLIKQMFGSSEINRIKSAMGIFITLDPCIPIINSLSIESRLIKDYVPRWETALFTAISNALDKISIGDIEQEGFTALRDCPKIEPKPVPPMEIQDINLDSIKKIKF